MRQVVGQKAEHVPKATCHPNQQSEYGIQTYCIVGAREMYCHSIWDNGSGNKLPSSPGERYTQLFYDLNPAFDRGYMDDPAGKVSGVVKNSPSALWSLQMLHQTQKQPDPLGKRNIFMDNFYKGHTLAEKVKALSNDEICISGTCHLNVIDKVNKVGVKQAIDLLRDKQRGSWALVHVFNAPIDMAANCGYIVYKDQKDVVFYSNDLADTPNELVVIGNEDEHAITCVNGSGKVTPLD